jgi:hypothetical protein
MPFYAKGDRLSVELEDFVADGGVIILLGILFILLFLFLLNFSYEYPGQFTHTLTNLLMF